MERATPKPIKAGDSNFIAKLLNQIKNFFVPISTERKKRRYTQFRNCAIFVLSSILFYVFEDYINKLVSIDTSELQKGMMAGPGSPF